MKGEAKSWMSAGYIDTLFALNLLLVQLAYIKKFFPLRLTKVSTKSTSTKVH